ncbi:MAG TPA: nuclear transport factor 2 family protein [Chitinophagaceae bacterium]
MNVIKSIKCFAANNLRFNLPTCRSLHWNLCVISFMFFAVAANSQNKSGTESVIKDLEQLVVKGILDADTNLLKQLWDPAFMVNNPRNNIAKDRNAVLDIQKQGLINYSSFERVIEGILVEGNVVITMGNETFVSRTDIPGAKAGQQVKRRFTNIWMKKKGKWLQVGRHASIICSP